jgi:hypothetical protein
MSWYTLSMQKEHENGQPREVMMMYWRPRFGG